MTTVYLKAVVLALMMMAAPLAASAAEVTLFISNAVKTVLEDMGPRFERESGHKLIMTFGSTNPLKARIEKNESFDLTILGEDGIDELTQKGRLVAASRTVVARSGMGVAIRKGAPKPDLSTAEAFRRTMLNAKSVAYIDGGITGSYLAVLFQRLGITENMKAKFVNTRGGEAVARGEVELGVTQISEVLYEKGAELAGPLPPEIQNYTRFSAALSVNARQADAARALLKMLVSPEAARVLREIGMEPPG